MTGASRRWLNAIAIASLVGCSGQFNGDDMSDDNGSNGDVDHPHDNGDTKDPLPTAQVCSNITSYNLDDGPGTDFGMRADLAVDGLGNLYYVNEDGLRKLSAEGVELYARAFGEFVAADASGNAYVAGSFSDAIDLGLGEMRPDGNVDTFIVKLSADGKAVFARQLHLCGDGLLGLAVALDGRIAISGSAMGTVVLDSNGEFLFSSSISGKVAFDALGMLYVAGGFTGLLDIDPQHRYSAGADGDAFVVKLDKQGHYVAHVIIGDADLPIEIPGGPVSLAVKTRQIITSLAINMKNEIAIGGEFDYQANVFGQVMTHPGSTSECGTYAGSFVAKLDANLDAVFARSAEGSKALDDVAIDAKGAIVVAGAGLSCAGTGYLQTFLRYDADASITVLPFGGGNQNGRVYSAVFDACGTLYSVASHSSPSNLVPIVSMIRKLAP